MAHTCDVYSTAVGVLVTCEWCLYTKEAKLPLCPYRLTVRIQPSQGCDAGSTPAGGTYGAVAEPVYARLSKSRGL